MDRRRFLKAAGLGAAGLFAGCSAEPTDEATATDSPDGSTTGTSTGTPESGTETATEGTTTGTATAGPASLRVGTYPAFLDAPSTSPGGWVKEEFESRHDVELEWFAPKDEMTYFLQRRGAGEPIETDLYLGLTAEDLVRTDQGVEDDEGLFASVDTARLSNVDSVVEDFRFDPRDRAVPFGASYVSLVYNRNLLDERDVGDPETFDDLTSPDFEDGLLVPSPQGSTTGLKFLLWTVDHFGEEGYLDYWSDLTDNGTRVLNSWGDAYDAYSNGEAPMVVSFSTDQVFADRYDYDMAEHQVGFPDGEGYRYVDGMAPFRETEKTDLAVEFMNFVLDPEVQAEIAERNVGLPAVENATLPEDYDDLVYEPEEIVGLGYDDLVGNMDGWVDSWSRQIASQ